MKLDHERQQSRKAAADGFWPVHALQRTNPDVCCRCKAAIECWPYSFTAGMGNGWFVKTKAQKSSMRPTSLIERRCLGLYRRFAEEWGELFYCNACNTAVGLRSITLSKTSDAPLGERSPRSQCRRVATEKPKRAANCSCVRRSRWRRSDTLTACGWYSFTPVVSVSLVLACAMASVKPC